MTLVSPEIIMDPQRGLKWGKNVIFGPQPVWSIEPDVSSIERTLRKVLDQPAGEECSVEFFGQGAFNKLYKVSCSKGNFMMRISLPVDPKFKTLSEVATIAYAREHTGFPLAKIIAYDASNQNEVGFEWILMELMPGEPLTESWKSISWAAKERLVRRVALYSAQLYRQRFSRIGNIFQTTKSREQKENTDAPEGSTSSDGFHLGRIVSMPFLLGDHLMQDVPRGPFETAETWLLARLQFVENDWEKVKKESDDEDDIADADEALQLVRRLRDALSLIFKPGQPSGDQYTALFHEDLNGQNILVDEDGELQAVVDWECISAVPLFKAASYPHFLDGNEREEQPDEERYGREDDGELCDLYWEALQEWEQSRLRNIWINEMEKLEPEWVEMFRASTVKADFETAVLQCDDGFMTGRIGKWLTRLENGEVGHRLYD